MSSSIYVIGHKSPDTDSICSAIAYAYLKGQLGQKATPARAGEINKETEFVLSYFNVPKPQLLNFFNLKENADRPKVILVDHNESKQVIEGISFSDVIEVIDHHRLGDLKTEEPIFILIEPVGCTATIVTEIYDRFKIELPSEIAGLLLSAIISDTVLFRSPTCTEKDIIAANKLAILAKVDLEIYGREMLKAASDLSQLSISELINNDLKEFSSENKVFTIAQLSVMDTKDILAKKDELLVAMEEMRVKNNYFASFLMITNILEESTELVFVGSVENIVVKAFGESINERGVFLPNVMSRKKQIVPPLLGAFV